LAGRRNLTLLIYKEPLVRPYRYKKVINVYLNLP
jgi:hypothetical protein